MENKTRNLIDLFAGAGGLTYGFFKNNFEIVQTVEFWKPALDTYNNYFNQSAVPLDITDNNVRNSIVKKWKNKIDIVIGGFPCQGFSMAGKRDKLDPRNQLYVHTLDIIKRVKPNFFVLENVKGILSFKESDGELVISKIKRQLFDFGYYCDYCILDSSNFGVPQKRERVIFIGAKKSEKKLVIKTMKLLKNHKEDTKTVRDAILDLENNEIEIHNHDKTLHTQEMIKKMALTRPGESAMKSFSDAWKRIYYDKPSPTVKENHGGVHVHPILNRVLTPRELARLQSFPDDFVFFSTKSNVLKQIGNAVPPKLSFEIAKTIVQVFYGK